MAATTFEQHLAARKPGPEHTEGPCTVCCEREPVTSDGYCRECLQYEFGCDETEEHVVTSMIEGMVTGALEAYVSSDLIVMAVHRAIEKDRGRQEESWGRMSSRATAEQLMEQLRASIDRIGGK